MSTGQLAPLVGLRWRMVRARRARWGFVLLAATLPVLCGAAVVVGLLLPRDRLLDVTILAPTAYLSVALLALIAPLFAGGGNELFPAEQLTAFPVRARTYWAASLVLAPLNLAWSVQLVMLLGLTAYLAGPVPSLPLALFAALAFLALVTVAGQALGWGIVGVRQGTVGRRVIWVLGAGALAAAAIVTITGNVTDVLDRSPLLTVVQGGLAAGRGDQAEWSVTVGLLVLLAVSAERAGRRVVAWTLRRPADARGSVDTRTVRRRGPVRTARSELLAVDRASVRRSPSLRRGLLVLGVLPGAAAAAAGLEWPSLVLLPGLVCAGAGLLFGVNAFCLDGSGALWLASLPRQATLAFWCKTQVVAETCLAAVATTLAAGALRAGRAPTATEATAVVACATVVLLRVVATAMELSVTRPYRADLRGLRDTPAPPGVMAAYSARLAFSTTLVAVFFAALAEVASWPWPLACALPFGLLSARRLVRAARLWEEPAVRGRLVAVVAAG